MVTVFCMLWIKQLARFFRHHHIPDPEIPRAIHNVLFISHCLYNGLFAAICGYCTAFYFERDIFVAVRIAVCMSTVGYYLHIIPKRNFNKFIHLALTTDDK